MGGGGGGGQIRVSIMTTPTSYQASVIHSQADFEFESQVETHCRDNLGVVSFSSSLVATGGVQ